MGSVKDLRIIQKAYEDVQGVGEFIFSDRWSGFDYGEMPDHIYGKGAALAVMSAFNFEQLEKRGIQTHYRGLITPTGELIRFDDLEEMGKGAVSNDETKRSLNGKGIMSVDLAVRYDPVARRFDEQTPIQYDYSFFQENRGKLNNFLIPLEVIFRNGLPAGSSVFKRIEKAKTISDSAERESALQQIYQKLGVTEELQPGSMLPRPVIGYTTKLESGDRHLSDVEAFEISGLTLDQSGELWKITKKVNDYITERAEETGLGIHWDGKVEFIYANGICLADVVGTLDENRFGADISKEALRQWYHKNQPEFVEACSKYKKQGEGWQELCPVKPKPLPEGLVNAVSEMYLSACNQYVGKQIFPALELDEVMKRIEDYR